MGKSQPINFVKRVAIMSRPFLHVAQSSTSPWDSREQAYHGRGSAPALQRDSDNGSSRPPLCPSGEVSFGSIASICTPDPSVAYTPGCGPTATPVAWLKREGRTLPVGPSICREHN